MEANARPEQREPAAASWAELLRLRLDAIEDARRYRRARLGEDPSGPVRRVDGHPMLCFAGNDYLGLAAHPAVVDALVTTARETGVGAGAAHLLGGHHRCHEQLEEALAAWLGRSRALLFSTGYMANLAIVDALAGREATVLGDKLNHASLVDAARLARARFRRYAHADPEALERRLADARGPTLVLTDGVFSMDGDRAPLAALARLCADPHRALVVDEAHALGVLGPEGRGSVAEAGLTQDAVPLVMGTLGKALGSFGAFVAGPEEWIESLRQTARSYIYTTAAPPALAAATLAALEIARGEDWRREHLAQLVRRFRQGAERLGLELLPSDTPIQPLLCGSEARALELSARLETASIWVPAVRPPTVPRGQSRLRITFSALHEAEQVDRLLEVLAACV